MCAPLHGYLAVRRYAEIAHDRAEREREEGEGEGEEEASDEGEEAPIYNPKNLPLGWDGKPIPYWL